MVTMFDEDAARSRSHGLRPEVLAAQADRLGLRPGHRPVHLGRPTTRLRAGAARRSQPTASRTSIFGDILFDEHRRWAERMCEAAGLTAVEPLWGSSTDDALRRMGRVGRRRASSSRRAPRCSTTRWLGRRLSADLLPEFERLGVDPCGERGEYHTVVTNSRCSARRCGCAANGTVQRSDCWALDMVDDAAGD